VTTPDVPKITQRRYMDTVPQLDLGPIRVNEVIIDGRRAIEIEQGVESVYIALDEFGVFLSALASLNAVHYRKTAHHTSTAHQLFGTRSRNPGGV
jgi:hypothetical protein